MFDATGAKCRETDPEVFFPEREPGIKELQVIISLCSKCPVFVKCKDYALQNDVDGYWAGMSKAQRKQLQQQMNIEPKSIMYSVNYWVISQEAIKKREQREQQKKVS